MKVLFGLANTKKVKVSLNCFFVVPAEDSDVSNLRTHIAI